MTKTKVVFLIISIILIAAGMTIFGVCYAKGNRFDDNIKYVNNTYEINEDFNKINIDLSISKVEIIKGEKNEILVSETDKLVHEVKVLDNELKITNVDKAQWYEKFLIFGTKYSVKIYLNNSLYESLNIKCSTGDISVSEGFEFKNINVVSSTGSIRFNAIKSDNLTAKLSTGHFEINGGNVDNINVVGSTGEILLKNVNTTKSELKVSTGSLKLDNVIAEEEIRGKASTGSIRFDGIDAKLIVMEASTGSITGSVLHDMIFVASSSTGSVNVPSTTTGGRCELKTSTGSINVNIKK